MILGIDTSAGQCAVALVRADRTVVAERADAMERGHAEALFPMIEAVLAEAGAAYADLTRVGVCTGPGSFTGIRVGVAAARGLALGCAVPAIGIDRFDALWQPVDLLQSPGDAGVAVALAGPRDTAYLRLYDAHCAPEGDDLQLSAAELEARAGPNRVRFGDGWPGADRSLGLVRAAVLARMAMEIDDPEPPAPHYIRGPNADLPREAPPALLD